MKAMIQKLASPSQSSFIYRVKSSREFRFNWHFHPEYELTYIERSHGRRFVGDNIARYADGDLVLLGPNLPHTWESSPSGTHRGRHKAYVIQFSEQLWGNDGQACVEMRPMRKLLERSDNGLSFTGPVRSSAARRIKALHHAIGVRRLTGLVELLDMLARSRGATEISSPRFVPSLHLLQHRRIDRVMQYINENYLRNLSHAEVAGQLKMSPAAFSTFFKRTVGMTYIKYVNSLRISHACQLLIDGDLAILDICHRSGFNNLSNFNRRFLEAKGMSPRNYRAKFQTANC